MSRAGIFLNATQALFLCLGIFTDNFSALVAGLCLVWMCAGISFIFEILTALTGEDDTTMEVRRKMYNRPTISKILDQLYDFGITILLISTGYIVSGVAYLGQTLILTKNYFTKVE